MTNIEFWASIGKKRSVIAVRLHAAGMSFVEIAQQLSTSPEYVERLVRWHMDDAAKRLLGEKRSPKGGVECLMQMEIIAGSRST